MASGNLTFTAADPFGFASTSGINATADSQSTARTYSQALDADGNVACESDEFDVITSYSQEYSLCPNLAGYPTSLKLGAVVSGIVITDISISFSNTDHPTLSVSGHAHGTSTHDDADLRKYTPSIPLPASTGNGIPNIAADYVTMAGTSTLTSADITWSLDHIDKLGATGAFFDGQNRAGLITLSVSGNGTADDATLDSEFTIDSADDSTSNTDANTFSLSAHNHVDLT